MSTKPTCKEAMEIASRFIAGHFNNAGEHPRISIPANPDRDDDLRLIDFIQSQDALLSSVRKLVGEWREKGDFTNGYMRCADDLESLLAQHPEVKP